MYSPFPLVLRRLYVKNLAWLPPISVKAPKYSERFFVKQIPDIVKTCFGKVFISGKSFTLLKCREMSG